MTTTKSQLISGLKKATIEMLLLRFLSESDKYGYQLCQEFKKRSTGIYTILEGSMYPILYRLTEQNYITFYEKKVGVRQVRIYYHITEEGNKYLETLVSSYREFSDIIEFLLSSNEGESYESNNK